MCFEFYTTHYEAEQTQQKVPFRCHGDGKSTRCNSLLFRKRLLKAD